LIVKNGVVKSVTRRSGHYQPTEGQLNQFINELKRNDFTLKNVDIGAGF